MNCAWLTAITTNEYPNHAVEKPQQINIEILNRLSQPVVRSVIADFSDPIIDREYLYQLIQSGCKFVQECCKVAHQLDCSVRSSIWEKNLAEYLAN